jgi:predicted methyltransferase
MSRIFLLISMLAVAACQPPSDPGGADAPSASVAPAPGAEVGALPSLAERLAGRSEADRARDAARKPAEVIAFLGIAEGMTVLDVFSAGGWYAEVLSQAVGSEGTVYAQNTEFLLSMRDGANEKAMTARLADDRLPNVQRLDREMEALGLAPESVDAAMLALNFHDIYNRGGLDGALEFLGRIHTVLKPGGVLGLIDHHGAAGNDNAALHRVEKARVLEVIEASPFVLEAESDVLANPDDDLSAMVFAPEIRGKTSRFLLRLRKAG